MGDVVRSVGIGHEAPGVARGGEGRCQVVAAQARQVGEQCGDADARGRHPGGGPGQSEVEAAVALVGDHLALEVGHQAPQLDGVADHVHPDPGQAAAAAIASRANAAIGTCPLAVLADPELARAPRCAIAHRE